ncbi:MAG: PEGA domain-containing protein [Deltaproteobacteria bacterium]|nr:PEGA domain-containing protein [Deltaproteobacteria bacterium]
MKVFLIPALLFFLGIGEPRAQEGGGDPLSKGVRAAQQKNYPLAYSLFKKALEDNNMNIDLYFNLGQLAVALKKCDEAVIFYSAFLYLSPNSVDAKDASAKISNCEKSLKNAGTISLDSEPQGVEVFINGAIVGKTPIKAKKLAAGTYRVEIDHPDYEFVGHKVKVESGKDAALTEKLSKKKAFGYLVVTTMPEAGVNIFLDDQSYGTSPMKEPLKLETGRYLLKLEMEGYDRWVRYVTIDREKTVKVEAELEKKQ